MRTRAVFGFALLFTVGALPALTSLQSASAATIVEIPSTIASDCSRDVSAEINAWIASVPDGTTLAFGVDACYRVDGTILVRQRVGLTFLGNHATFRAVTDGTELINPKLIRTRSMWKFGGGGQHSLSDVIVIGANPYAGVGDLAYQPKFEAQHAYLVSGTQGITFERIEAYDVYGDFVWVGPGTRDMTVRGSTFARNGRQGWTINGTNILFENNSIRDTRRATIDMEPSLPTWASQNVTIRDNVVGRGRLFFFASVGAAAPINNVNIIRNKLVGKALVMFVVPPKGTRSNYRVIGNTSDVGVSGFGGAMVFRNINNLEVRGNVMKLQLSHWKAGVSVGGCTNVSVRGNVFRGAKMAVLDRGLNVNLRQWNNWISWPMFVSPATYAPGPTPIPPPGFPSPTPRPVA